MASKYDPLKDHLLNLTQRLWHASFAEIEQILGFRLPKSARNHNAWWSNERSGSHIQSHSWQGAGWETQDLNLTLGKVLFIKIGAGRANPPSPATKPHSQSAPFIPQARPEPSQSSLPEAMIRTSLRFAWLPMGKVALDNDRKPVFPKLPVNPGLYRIQLRGEGNLQVYVGETDNLQRRFAHYRNPGPSQATNIRLNQHIVELINEKGTVDIAIITSSAWISLNGGEKRADFAIKAVRCIFENLAQVQSADDGSKSLNR